MESRATFKRMGWAACILAVALLALAVVSGGLARSAEIGRPAVSDAAIRLPAVPGRPAAGYFMLMGGPAADRLLSVTAPAPVRVELHETRRSGGRATMAPIASLPVPAGAHIMFEPGGRHLMLFGLPTDFKPGASLRLTFRFEKAGAVAIDAAVRPIDKAAGHAHH